MASGCGLAWGVSAELRRLFIAGQRRRLAPGTREFSLRRSSHAGELKQPVAPRRTDLRIERDDDSVSIAGIRQSLMRQTGRKYHKLSLARYHIQGGVLQPRVTAVHVGAAEQRKHRAVEARSAIERAVLDIRAAPFKRIDLHVVHPGP